MTKNNETTENSNTQPKKMSKADLLAALQSDDFDREALVQRLQEETRTVAPFRERPEVKAEIERFNTARQKGFQPAIYKKDPEVLTVALKEMLVALEGVAEAAGINLHPEVDEEG